MDITLLFSEYLKAKGAQPVLSSPFDVSQLNGFMVDAYRINTLLNDLVRYLRTIRSPYLTLHQQRARTRLANGTSKDHVQPFSDQQRKQVDSAMKEQLTKIDKSIQELDDTARLELDLKDKIRQQKQRKRGFGLGNWASGGSAVERSPEQVEEDARVETQKAHRDGVILSLRMRLQKAGKVQEDIVSTRLKREIERSQNILSSARSERFAATFPASSTAAAQQPISTIDIEQEDASALRASREQVEAQLSPDQLQQLQAEEQGMLQHYNAELAKIQQAQRSVLEISSLQTELTMQLNVQAEGISQLVGDTFEVGENVRGGNRELEKATQRMRPAQWVFYGSLGTGCFLVLWDLIF